MQIFFFADADFVLFLSSLFFWIDPDSARMISL